MLMRREPRLAPRAGGFTILEVMVTLGLFAILTAVAVPTFSVWIRNTKVRAVADALQNGMRLAQSESVRRSRQVVFSLTNTSSPQNGFTAAANGSYWVAYTIPSMTDGSETAQFIQSGVLSGTSSGVSITGPAAVCFNSMGRLVVNSSAGVTGITGGATCAVPTATPPLQPYNITIAGAVAGQDHPLRVNLALGGQVHLCDQSKTLSASTPDGCP